MVNTNFSLFFSLYYSFCSLLSGYTMSSTLWRVLIAAYATYAAAATLCAVDAVTRSIAIDTADLLAMSGLCVRVHCLE